MKTPPARTPCRTRHAIILAAGESTRTRPLTLHRPKPLIPLLGQPLLAHILNELVGIVNHVTLVVGYRADDIRNTFGASYRGIKLSYVMQQQVNGTAGALLAVADQEPTGDTPLINGPFFLFYGDNLISHVDLPGVCQERYSLAGLKVDDPKSFGVLDIQGDRVVRIIEKSPDPPPGAPANPGLYHFDEHVLPILRHIEPSPRGEYELTDLIGLLAQEHHVGYSMCQGHWIPVGTPWDVLIASAFLLKCNAPLRSEIHPDASLEGCDIRGWVRVGRARVGKGTRIIGPAYLGDGVVVGANCTIDRSTLEAGTTIGNHSTIQQSVVLTGATVGSECVIQSSVMDTSASVGYHAHLAANVFDDVKPVAHTVDMLDRKTLLTRGVVVGPGMVVPAEATLEPGTVLSPEQ